MPICSAVVPKSNVLHSENTQCGWKPQLQCCGQALASEDAGVAIIKLSVFSLTAGL